LSVVGTWNETFFPKVLGEEVGLGSFVFFSEDFNSKGVLDDEVLICCVDFTSFNDISHDWFIIFHQWLQNI
jgi:hypothetical protein